jgi:hypothetical protein
MLVQVGTGDVVLDDAHRLADHARAHGVAVERELYPVDTHSFQVFWSFLPEAADALASAGKFIHRSMSARAGTAWSRAGKYPGLPRLLWTRGRRFTRPGIGASHISKHESYKVRYSCVELAIVQRMV